jgi:hypothetical protein
MRKQRQQASTPGSTFVVRVAGLPMESLHSLRFNQTVQLIEEVFVIENSLHAQAESLSEALYSTIGTIEDKKIRYQLMAFRRAIYQIQLPKTLSDDVWALLPTELTKRLQIWLEERKKLGARLAHGQDILEVEWAEKSRELQHLAQQELFQQGLVLASKDLYEDLLRWLPDGEEGSQHRDRQIELGLLTYLTRMTTKTSPFSTFMSSSRGHWIDDNPLLTNAPAWQRRSAVALNWSIVHRIAAEIVRWPEIRSKLALRVNSSLVAEGDCLKFLGWKPGETSARKGEVVRILANPPLMQEVIQIIRNAEGLSYTTIIQAIAQTYPQKEVDEIQQVLDQLLAIGLLELDLGLPDLSSDYLGQLLLSLQQFPGQKIESTSLLLQKVQTCLQQYAEAEHAIERHKLRNTIHATLEDIYQQLGFQERGIAVPTTNAFYEDTLLEKADIRCSLTGCQDLLEDLELLRQLSALYERNLSGCLAATTFFIDHYGKDANIGLLCFYEEFCREQAQPGGWRPGYRVSGSQMRQLFEHFSSPPPVDLAELNQIHSLQEEFLQRFVQQPESSSSVCQLDAVALREFVAGFPAFLSAPRSLAFYCQMLVYNGKPQLVLNALRSGFGRGEGQLQFLETQIHKPVSSSHIERAQYYYKERKALWTDILGVFGSNTSLRIAQTSYEITYPGTVSNRPAEEQIQFNDLSVTYDPHKHRLQLFSRRLQQTVLPAHLGLLDDFWQPPLYRFLIHIFSEGAVNPLLVLFQIPNPQAFETGLPVQFYPRLCLGSLVLRRATWIVGVQNIPKHEKGTSSFDYMLNVQRWLVTHQIPQECFVRVPAALTKDRKPLAIDFSNYLSIMLFEQIVTHAEQNKDPIARVMLLQETLPGSEDLVLSDENASYVSEFVIELTDV